MRSVSLRLLVLRACLIVSAPALLGAQPLVLVEKEVGGALAGVGALAIAPDSSTVHAATSSDDSLVTYGVDPDTGELSLFDEESNGLNEALAVAVSPDGESVYVASHRNNALVAFARDTQLGTTTFVEIQSFFETGVRGIWQIQGVAVAGNGDYVVASGVTVPSIFPYETNGSVVLFHRDPATSELSLAHSIFDDFTPGVTGLGEGGAVTVSPDGLFLYIASAAQDSVVVVEIDAALDQLVFRGLVTDGVDGVDGLAGANAVAFDAGGEFAYVTGAEDNSLAVFERDPSTGLLSFVEVFVDGVDGVDGLSGAHGAVVSPSGDRVYAAGTADSAVAIFARRADGLLSPLSVARDEVDGLDGLAGARSPRLSGDGATLYVAASNEAAIGVFEVGDAFDFGDAPDPTFPTFLASDGARHVISVGFRLGAAIDEEMDGQAGSEAVGDDQSVVDDEDGVIFTGALIPGQPAAAQVTATAAGLVDAWIDFDGDGSWSGTGERVASGLVVAAGANTMAFVVPANALPDSAVYARFRLSTAGVAAPTGVAADGEVEDYLIPIGHGADLGVSVSGTPTSDWQQPYTFTVTVANGGPNDVTGAVVAVAMSAEGGPVTWSCVATGGTCTAAGAGEVADLVDLTPGGTAVYTLLGVVFNDAPGPYVTAHARVQVPAGVFDPVSANDTGFATVLILTIFEDDFETEDTSRWSFAAP